MSRPNDVPRPDDPDETPTRVGGSGSGADPHAEDPTVPSMGKAGRGEPPARKTPPAAKSANDPLIGRELGGCRITALLGRGAMGAVYKARQVKLDRDVAVKVIRPEMMSDPRTLKRFEVEARTVGRFNSAHVVMVHDVGFEQGVHYLVMEFVQGKNLRDHVKLLAGGRLPAAEAIPLLRQACKGLEEAQRLGVIHRDIKPDNLMLTDRGVLKIADFGIAKPIQEDFSMTLTSELIGTPLYMSPEQCQGAQDLDFRSDMYSLGATFYYLLTGEPPVRASSVYELIQTKTKLENLCLWKALPDLDQNHPLSRVIERMTALDRDDRYESYEALLNDIVIVEAGGTVARLAPRPEKKELPKLEAPLKKSRGGALFAVVAAAAAAAGGLWWSNRPAPKPDDGTSNVASSTAATKSDPAALRARLDGLTKRLEMDGPSARLREEVKALPVTDSRDAEDKNRLLAAVDQGLAIEQRLLQIKAPESLELPFDTLKKHFKDVDDAAKVDASTSPLLRKWLERSRSTARAETALGSMAQSRLLGAFTQWKDARAKVSGGDSLAIVKLRESLAQIETSRRVLLTILPGLEASLDRDFPVQWIETAKSGLDKTNELPDEVDIGQALAEIRTSFDKNGPDPALANQVAALRTNKVDQENARVALMREIGTATERKNDAETTRTRTFPEEPRLPFDDVDEFWKRLDLALEPLRDPARQLPPWAEALRSRLRDEARLQDKVVAALGAAFAQWKTAAAGSDTARADAQLAAVVAGKERAAKWFPGAQAELDRAVSAPEIAEWKGRLELSGVRARWVSSARELQQQVADVRSLADWRANTKLAAALDAIAKAPESLANEPDVRAAQRALDDARGRWTKVGARFDEVAAKVAAADLSAADAVQRAPMLETEGREELRVFGECVASCRAAFRTLEQELDVGKALTQLQAADASLRPIAALAPAANERLQSWIKGVEALQAATAGMIAIPGGTVRGTRVESFFLSCTEVSRAEFAKFRAELRAAVAGKQGAARVAAVEPRLPGIGIDEVVLDELLGLDVREEPANMPAERLTWYAAAAFAAWRQESLPRLEEWQLAAFGDDKDSKAYPWGPKWSDEPRYRNPDTGNPMAVDDGGESWRAPRLRHLGGNMAEWLYADAADKNASLAGGRYFERSRTAAEEQAKGQPLSAAKLDAVRGYGARTMLRLKSFAAITWPR